MNNCIFCKIINKEIGAYIVYNDEDIIAFLDISQSTYGHTLIVPKTHYENFLTLPNDLAKKTIVVAKQIANKMMTSLDGIEGFNLLNNNFATAGQEVMHYHLHLIPRYKKDELTIKSNHPLKLNNEEFIKLKELIKI